MFSTSVISAVSNNDSYNLTIDHLGSSFLVPPNRSLMIPQQKSGAETEHNRVPTNGQNPAPKSENIVSSRTAI